MAINYNDISQLNVEQLRRPDLGSVLNFQEITADISRIKDVFLFFQGKESHLTHNQIDGISALGEEFLNICKQIQAFTTPAEESQQSIINRRADTIKRAVDFSRRFDGNIIPIKNDVDIRLIKSEENIKLLEGKVQDLERRASVVDKDFNTRLEDATRSMDELKSDFTKTSQDIINQAKAHLDDARNISQKAKEYSIIQVTGRFGTIFGDQAKKNKRTAIISLVFFLLTTTATIFIAWGLFKPLIDGLKDINGKDIAVEYYIAQLVLRLTIVSVLFLFVKESLRNFNINMHLYNLNKHRQNALESFATFTSNANDDSTKSYIIKEITKAIYSMNRIGYLEESKGSLDFSQMLEIIKNIKP